MTSNASDLVKVKPLEWEKSRFNSWNGDYHTIPTAYTVRCADENGWKWSGHGGFGYSGSPETAKASAQADYESRILAALTPAEQFFEVKPGYCLQAYIDNSVHEPVEWVDPSEALTIRSAKEVRREALEEAEQWLWEYMGTKQHGLYVKGSMTKALTGTPIPSTDTTPTVAEAAKVLLDDYRSDDSTTDYNQAWEAYRNALWRKDESIYAALESFLRALAEQTGGE